MTPRIRVTLAALALLPLTTRLATAQQKEATPGSPLTPAAVRLEHEELNEELVRATKLAGPVGDAARDLARLLHPHFVREEQIALPELGLLLPLSRNDVEVGMADVLPLVDSLRRELPAMLREHQRIAAAAQSLGEAARRARMPEWVRFAHELQLHAQVEEQVMYPAALLVGQAVRRQLSER